MIQNIRYVVIILKILDIKLDITHWLKSVCIQSFSGPYFPTFELNMARYFVFLRMREFLSHRIQSKGGKIQTRKTSSTDAFYAVTFTSNADIWHWINQILQFCISLEIKLNISWSISVNIIIWILLWTFTAELLSQLTFTCSKSTIKTLGKGSKYVQI